MKRFYDGYFLLLIVGQVLILSVLHDVTLPRLTVLLWQTYTTKLLYAAAAIPSHHFSTNTKTKPID